VMACAPQVRDALFAVIGEAARDLAG